MHRRRLLLEALKFFDLALVATGLAFSMLVVSSGLRLGSFKELLTMRMRLTNVAILLCFMVSWHYIFSFFELYHSHRLSPIRKEATDVTKAISAAAITLLVGAFAFNIRIVTPLFIVFFWALTTLGAIASRLVLRFGLRKIRSRGRNLRTMVIVGTNSRALAFAKKIESRPDMGYVLKGFVDDEVKSGEIGTGRFRLVAGFDALPELLRRNVVDEVVITLPIKSFYERIASIVAICEEQGILARFLSDLFNAYIAKTKTELVDGQAVTTISTNTRNESSLFFKRLLDMMVSIILLPLASPLFLLAAVLIKLTSPGPVFFTQDRLGINKRLFRLYKFRTMVVDAEKRLNEIEHLNEVQGPAILV